MDIELNFKTRLGRQESIPPSQRRGNEERMSTMFICNTYVRLPRHMLLLYAPAPANAIYRHIMGHERFIAIVPVSESKLLSVAAMFAEILLQTS